MVSKWMLDVFLMPILCVSAFELAGFAFCTSLCYIVSRDGLVLLSRTNSKGSTSGYLHFLLEGMKGNERYIS